MKEETNIVDIVNSDEFGIFLRRKILEVVEHRNNLYKNYRSFLKNPLEAKPISHFFKASPYDYVIDGKNDPRSADRRIKEEFLLIIKKRSNLSSAIREYINCLVVEALYEYFKQKNDEKRNEIY